MGIRFHQTRVSADSSPNHCCWKMFLVVLTPTTFLSSSVCEFWDRSGDLCPTVLNICFLPQRKCQNTVFQPSVIRGCLVNFGGCTSWSGQCFVVHVISLISAEILQQSLCMFVMHMYDMRTCTYAK